MVRVTKLVFRHLSAEDGTAALAIEQGVQDPELLLGDAETYSRLPDANRLVPTRSWAT